jgi:hypothetical protein
MWRGFQGPSQRGHNANNARTSRLSLYRRGTCRRVRTRLEPGKLIRENPYPFRPSPAWDEAGELHLAGIESFELAEAAYRAAVHLWPAERIMLRQGARVLHDSGQRPRNAKLARLLE